MTFPTYHYNLTLAMVYFRIQSLAAVGSIRSQPHKQGSQSLSVGGGPVTTYYTVLLERSSADKTQSSPLLAMTVTHEHSKLSPSSLWL